MSKREPEAHPAWVAFWSLVIDEAARLRRLEEERAEVASDEERP